ncbi:hypothetical protein AAMO2058_000620000 [Amorphochlora amoebiformis]
MHMRLRLLLPHYQNIYRVRRTGWRGFGGGGAAILGERAKRVRQSGIREVMELAWEVERNTKPGQQGLIHLEVGQPDFESPNAVLKAASKAITNKAYQSYISNQGLPDLREAVSSTALQNAHRSWRENSLVTQGCVTVCHGAVGAISSVLHATLNIGDEILIPDPSWSNYAMMVTLLGGVPIPYSLHRSLNWCPDPDEVSKLCGDKTKGIIITSPSNPCGSVMPMETLSSLARLSSTKGLLVISDEIYSRVYYGEGLRAPGLLQVDCMDLDPERLVVVDGVSKYWAMTGFRVGWAAATAALTDPSALLEAEKMTRNFKKRRDAAIRVVREFGLYEYTPQGAFYMLIKATDGDDMEFCKRLLQEERVAVSPGSAFGDVAKGFVRISLASSLKDVENGVKKLCQTILNSR